MSETVNKETQARWEAAVFCDAATESVFRTVAEQSGRSFTAVIEGGVAAAKKWLAVNTAPAAVFVDVAGERFPASALAEVAQTAGPGCRLIAVGTAKDLTLYKTLLASGVFDYLVKPLAASDVTDYTVAQARTAKLLLAELGDAPEGQRRFVVVNRAHSGEKPVLTKSQFENFLDVKVAAELPFAGNAMETALLTGPVTAEKAPAFDAAVKALGARLLGRPEKPLAKASPLAALKALLTRGTKSC